MTVRAVRHLIPARSTSDGAGVRIRRSLGQNQAARLDPFLMLDEFGSERAEDYIAGFPAHPHRGFETVTYMLEGHMLHEDHMGNRGDLRTGGVQWMTAGRGIIHSEMPQQTEGAMRGFQLWLNLPARDKMRPPAYRDIAPEEIPLRDLPDGAGRVRVIAGELQSGNGVVPGPVRGGPTDPLYLDVELSPGAGFEHPLAPGRNGFLYMFEGSGLAGETHLPVSQAAVLGDGDTVRVEAGPDGARFLLLAGTPIDEPVVQYGPFVMNTREEIEQALRDFRDGRLADPGVSAGI